MPIEYTGAPATVKERGHISTDWDAMPEWITTEEAAEISGYHPEHVRWLARGGKIGAEEKRRDWWIDRDRFRKYLAPVEALGAKKFDPRGAPELTKHDGE